MVRGSARKVRVNPTLSASKLVGRQTVFLTDLDPPSAPARSRLQQPTRVPKAKFRAGSADSASAHPLHPQRRMHFDDHTLHSNATIDHQHGITDACRGATEANAARDAALFILELNRLHGRATAPAPALRRRIGLYRLHARQNRSPG